jgi:hypothetical protein
MENFDMATQPASKSRLVVVVIIILGGAGLIGIRSLAPAPSHEGQGTITSIDAAARTATVEAIDPANGNRRDYVGSVPAECPITINGKPAKLEDLRVGDLARVRVRSDRKTQKVAGKRPVIAEMIEVKRKEGSAS